MSAVGQWSSNPSNGNTAIVPIANCRRVTLRPFNFRKNIINPPTTTPAPPVGIAENNIDYNQDY